MSQLGRQQSLEQLLDKITRITDFHFDNFRSTLKADYLAIIWSLACCSRDFGSYRPKPEVRNSLDQEL